jgi:uncharacterized phage-associated protein
MNVMLSCFDVANYFIELANRNSSDISNSKLQKLVYYSQSWHLAIHDIALFEEDFEAWIHGPVIPILFQKYQVFNWEPIREIAHPTIPIEPANFLAEIAAEYFDCDNYELEKMTRSELPWNLARANLPPDSPSTSIIKKEWMREYYAAHVKEEPENQTEAIAEYQLLV